MSLIMIPASPTSLWDLPTVEEAKIVYLDVFSQSGRQLLLIKNKPFEGRVESILNPWLEVENRWIEIEGWKTEGARSNGIRKCKFLTYKKLQGMKRK